MPDPNDKQNNSQEIAKLAGKVMGDRKLLSMLSEKVYELMLEDLRHQKERSKNQGRL